MQQHMEKMAEIIKNAKCEHFIIETNDGKERKRLFVTRDGAICEKRNYLRNKGYQLTSGYVFHWRNITPDYKGQFSKEVSNCIALIKKGCTSRALDKYFENGEYTNKIVAEIKKRALKNPALYKILTNSWKWDF